MISETPLHALVAQAERDAKAHLDEAQRANLHGNDNTERMHRTLAQVHQWFADQIKAALLLTAGPQDWRPIETAPEATWVFVVVPNYGLNIATMTRDPNILGENGKYWFIRGENHRCVPTHWLPLPAPPQCGTPCETEVLL